METKSKYKRGQKVTCNGNPDAIILDQYMAGMYEVRLFSGLRHVGDVVVSEPDLDLENCKVKGAN